MAGPKGYSTYRGRGPRWKIALAVLLALVILAAVAVMWLQRHIVYDETGTPQLELPWQSGPKAEESGPLPPEEMELVIQEPEAAEETFYAFAAPVPLTRESWSLSARQAEKLFDGKEAAVVVTLKDSGGTVYFDSAVALSGSVRFDAEEEGVALAAVTQGERYAIARISCFQDPKVAKHYVTARGLQNTSGYIFHDGNNSQWLDPAKPDARTYLCQMAAEAAQLGFDEILLTDVSYPTEGKLEQIAYGEEELAANLMVFMQEMRTVLEPYGVKLSVELPAQVLRQGSDSAAGLVLADLVPQADRIYAAAELEEAAVLSEKVRAVSGSAMFVLETGTYDPALQNCLIG